MMRIFLLFIVFTSSTIYAQKYEFDYLTKYLTKFKDSKRESLHYSNSENDNYFLRISLGNSSQLIAQLFDSEKSKIHNFSVIETEFQNEINFKFKYENSTALNINKRDGNKLEFVFENLSEKDSIKNVKLSIYKNIKRKKPLMYLNMELKKNTYNLFPVFRKSCIHPYEFIQKLNNYENFVVVKAIGETLTGLKIEHNLIEVQKIDFELNITE